MSSHDKVTEQGEGYGGARNRVVGDFWGNSPSEKEANVVRVTRRRLFGGLVESGLVHIIGGRRISGIIRED